MSFTNLEHQGHVKILIDTLFNIILHNNLTKNQKKKKRVKQAKPFSEHHL